MASSSTDAPVPQNEDAETEEQTLLQPLSEDASNDDADSLYASSLAGTDTTSIKSAVQKYREENGRTYHSYGSTEHWGPNDAKAQDQQDLSHQLWNLSLKGRLYLAPIEKPAEVLDIGTGTGIWVMEMAEQNPETTVKGIDLSPVQPTWVPPNAFFEVDDYNVDWLDQNKFDLIHARELLGTCPDWVELYKKALAALKPGAYFEQHEPSLFFYSDLTTFAPDHAYTQWGDFMLDAGGKAGMRFDICDKMKGWMEEAGFVNVTEFRMPWLVGPWSKDKHQREVGQWNQLRLDVGIADFCSRRFSNQMGVSFRFLVTS